jgi:hypothetical protein
MKIEHYLNTFEQSLDIDITRRRELNSTPSGLLKGLSGKTL